MKDEYAEAIAARATDTLAKERADNAACLVALLEQAKKEKRAVENELDITRAQLAGFISKAFDFRDERDHLRDIVRRLVAAIDAMNALIVRLNPHIVPVDIQPGATCLGVDVGDAVREARDAIGEKTK